MNEISPSSRFVPMFNAAAAAKVIINTGISMKLCVVNNSITNITNAASARIITISLSNSFADSSILVE